MCEEGIQGVLVNRYPFREGTGCVRKIAVVDAQLDILSLCQTT